MSSSETATVEAEHLVGMPPVQSPPSQATTMTGPPPANTTPPKLYKLPAPVKTFPLPNFYPSNPVSLVYAAYKWMSHLLFTPNEPSVIYTGIWSPGSSSVHVVDLPSMRALWEQGFYGKGNFSRSEPEWMNRELARRGLRKGKVSIDVTEDRRVARQQKKWERARAEQEAIRKQREEEARLADEADKNMRENGMQVGESEDAWPAPVGPIELLRMPNSEAELETIIHANGHSHKMPNGKAANGHATTPLKAGHDLPNGVDEEESPVAYTNGAPREPGLKRQKSVRFSPVVDSTTFLLHDPPSPQHALLALKHPEQPVEIPPKTGVAAENGVAIDGEAEANDGEIVNREHLQLSPEEAFFLVFGLGALVVKDRDGDQPIKAEELFDRFRRYSYFPPRIGPTPRLGPDDPFLLQYVVYHHFRSLGWVPRAGHKFGVDWLLYMRGPVFDHAQFAVLVLPEYEDPEWRRLGRAEGTGKSWTWFFGVSRVISQVHKKLVLAYVCVPPPERFEEALGRGVAHALGMYKVREVMVARWSPNRNR